MLRQSLAWCELIGEGRDVLKGGSAVFAVSGSPSPELDERAWLYGNCPVRRSNRGYSDYAVSSDAMAVVDG